jgi:hypothetical protein
MVYTTMQEKEDRSDRNVEYAKKFKEHFCLDANFVERSSQKTKT